MIETILLIVMALAAAIWFFSLLEDWAEIGPIDHDDPEDP